MSRPVAYRYRDIDLGWNMDYGWVYSDNSTVFSNQEALYTHPLKEWRAWVLPNGIWEVVEWSPETYRTIVRGITKEQAERVAREHNEPPER